MSHTCVAQMVKVRNVVGKLTMTQGRCTICGKFMPRPGCGVVQTNKKDDLIAKFRGDTFIVEYTKDGLDRRHALTLDPTYIGNYVGKGTSKKSDDDTLYLYDIDNDCFRKLSVSGIKSVVKLGN